VKHREKQLIKKASELAVRTGKAQFVVCLKMYKQTAGNFEIKPRAVRSKYNTIAVCWPDGTAH